MRLKGVQMKEPQPKYVVPDHIKDRVRQFMNGFMAEHNMTKSALAELMHEKLGRSACRPSLVKKFSKATFQLSEVIEILDLFDCELKIVRKDPDRGSEKGKLSK